MNYFDIATVAIGLSSLACLAAKVACLTWAFMRTRKPASLVYLAFLVLGVILPVVMAYTLSPNSYASVSLLVGVGSGVIETGLFIWLVVSLLKRSVDVIKPID